MSKFFYLLLITSLFFLISCDDEESTDPRVGRPEVTILHPTDSSSVIDSVFIEALATDDNGVARVEIYINGQTDSTKTFTAPPYRYKWVVTSLADSSFHSISAKVFDHERKFGTSQTVYVRVLKFTPTNLRVTSFDNNSLTIKWNDNSSIETGFEIQASLNGFAFSPIDTVEKDITSLTIRQPFTPFKPYYYRVRALSDSLASAFSNVLIATLELLPPGNFIATHISDSTVKLQWVDKNIYETGFEVERSDNGTHFTRFQTLSPNVTSLTINGVFERGEDYYFRIRTFTATDTSGYSNHIKIFFRSSLYAGGDFAIIGSREMSKISEWNDMNWQPLTEGVNGGVYSMTEFQSKLFVGGNFTSAGGISANRIASWDGFTWRTVGSGMNGIVKALAVHANELYAGGNFTNAGGVTVANIARWNGSSWSAVGNGLNGTVNVLEYHQGKLYAGGNFTLSGNDTLLYLARWDGNSWSTVGKGVNGPVYSLMSESNRLYIGGDFTQSDTLTTIRIARWNGIAIEAIGLGVNNSVYAIEKNRSGTAVYIGGTFTRSDTFAVNKIAELVNVVWWAPLGNGLIGNVSALLTVQTNLYASENFSLSKGLTTNRILRWNNVSWEVVGEGLNGVTRALTTYSSWHWERMY